MNEQRTLKQCCKEAKKRLKQGFWQKYHSDLQRQLNTAEDKGLSVSVVKEFYSQKANQVIKNKESMEEEFYSKVKELLDSEGEVSNAIGRLTDKEYYNSLDYNEQQRYNLELSEKYLRAVERYKKEKMMQGKC